MKLEMPGRTMGGRCGWGGACHNQLILAYLAVGLLAAVGVGRVLGQPASTSGGLARMQLTSLYQLPPLSFTPKALPCPLPLNLAEIPNATAVTAALGLDDGDKQALTRNGLVVVPYGRAQDILSFYGESRDRGVPNFITSDSLLHLYHVQFDQVLQGVEANQFLPMLKVMTHALADNALSQYASLSGELQEAARRNVGFFAVALSLLGDSVSVPDSLTNAVQTELASISQHAGWAPSPLFVYQEDYSQYVPRGHYTRSSDLQRYFKAMMWYGRMAFLLKGSNSWGQTGDALVSVEDARIQTLQASLITLGLDSLQVNGQAIADLWNRIYGVTAFFVGLADDLTPYDYKEALHQVFGATVNIAALADPANLFALKAALAALPNPLIYGGTGNILVPPNATEADLDQALAKTKGMRLVGQRFVPDSYLLGTLVFPTVGRFTGTGTPFTKGDGNAAAARAFPRGLDVMAVLGSEAALNILDREGDTDYVGYDTTLNGLIALFRSFNQSDWTQNLYWGWLYSLQPLLSNYGEGYPAFMRTAAWQAKQLNTALASWTELRHDTILYAKQSYTLGITAVPPEPDRGYVEPVPEFYQRLLGLTQITRVGLNTLNVLDATQSNRLSVLEGVLDRLKTLALTEVEGRTPSAADYAYIQGIAAALAPLTDNLSDPQAAQTTLVADVHTDGNSGQVLEEGVGYVRVLVAAYRIPEGRLVLGAGPVLSYYEFKWPMSNRLTDEQWTNLLASANAPADPTWVRSFAHPVNVSSGDASGPAVRLAAPQLAQTGVSLRWNGVTSQRYRVFYSDDLQNWYLLQTPVVAENGLAGILDPAASTARCRFYRVQLVQ